MNKVSFIIPAHNEEDNIISLHDGLLLLTRDQDWQFEVVFVDDNSTDNTRNVIKKLSEDYRHIKPIYRTSGKRGMGLALKEGTDSSNGDLIVWLMADRSDKLNTIPELIHQLNLGADIAIASRYIKGGSKGNLNVIKAFFSKSYSLMVKLFLGLPIHDITNAFRAFKKAKYSELTLNSHDFCISPELVIKAHLKGFKLVEVPTTYKNRQVGKSKFNLILMGIKYTSIFIKSLAGLE